MSDFLTKADILAIHEEQVERFGGSQGLRDEGALEAAIFRAQRLDITLTSLRSRGVLGEPFSEPCVR